MSGTMMRLMRSPCAASTVVLVDGVLVDGVGVPDDGVPADGPEDVSMAQPNSSATPPTRQARDVAVFSVQCDMVILTFGSAHPRTDGVLSSLQGGAYLLLRPIEHVSRSLFHGLKRFDRPVANASRLAIDIVAYVVAPVPHGQSSGERPDHESHHLGPPYGG